MSDDAEILARFAVAERVAAAAGQLTLDYFRRSVAVERKSDQSPVTIADREAERLLREQIAAAFPDDGILGEEFPERVGSSPFRWILDPIDGTKSFISGVPLYATLVAVEFETRRDHRCHPTASTRRIGRRGGRAWRLVGQSPRGAVASPCRE